MLPNQGDRIERRHVQAVIADGKQADALADVAGYGNGDGCGLTGHAERIRDSGCDGTMSASRPTSDINPSAHSGPNLAEAVEKVP